MVFYMLPHPVDVSALLRSVAFGVCRPCCPKSVELQSHNWFFFFLVARGGACLAYVAGGVRRLCGVCRSLRACGGFSCSCTCVHALSVFFLSLVCLGRSSSAFLSFLLVLPTFCPSSFSFPFSLSFIRSLSLCLSIGYGYISPKEKHMDSDPRA